MRDSGCPKYERAEVRTPVSPLSTLPLLEISTDSRAKNVQQNIPGISNISTNVIVSVVVSVFMFFEGFIYTRAHFVFWGLRYSVFRTRKYFFFLCQ